MMNEHFMNSRKAIVFDLDGSVCGAADQCAGDRLHQYGFSHVLFTHMFDFIMTLLMNLNENGVHYGAKGGA